MLPSNSADLSNILSKITSLETQINSNKSKNFSKIEYEFVENTSGNAYYNYTTISGSNYTTYNYNISFYVPANTLMCFYYYSQSGPSGANTNFIWGFPSLGFSFKFYGGTSGGSGASFGSFSTAITIGRNNLTESSYGRQSHFNKIYFLIYS